MAPSPSFLLLRRESRPKADHLIALRRGLESSPRRGKRFCGMAFAPGAPRCSRENCGLFRVFPRSPRKHADLIFALLRGLKGHLEEERGILGTPFASSAPRCSREHCGLFKVFRSATPRKHTFSTGRSFSRTVLATRGCSHEGPLRSTHLRGAKNVCSEPRVVLTMASGCPGRFRSAEGAGTRNPSAAPIEKDAGEERGSFRKPRYSGSSA